MMQAIILHTIQDANHCMKHELHKNVKLFSANIHVIHYLQHHYRIECQYLCSYLEHQENHQAEEITRKINNLLVSQLDEKIAPDLNRQTDLSIRYFEPLYSWDGAKELFIYVQLAQCFRRMLAQHSFETILIYGWNFKLGRGLIETFLARIFPGVRFLPVRYKTADQKARMTISNVHFAEIPELLTAYDEHLFKSLALKKRGTIDKNIVVFEPVDKLCFFFQKPGEYNVYGLNPQIISSGYLREYELSHNCLPTGDSLEALRSAPDSMKPALFMLYENIQQDFYQNIVSYLQILHSYRRLHEETNIQYAYWEYPPIQGVKALLAEYFLKNEVTQVIGVQAKTQFFIGQRTSPYIFVNNFNRCHYYFSQGITSEDLNFEGLAKTTVIPQKALSDINAQSDVFFKNRTIVDIAIYLTPTSSFLQTGQMSANVTVQAALLDFLESHQGKNIHVVTHGNPVFENCAMLPTIKALRNITFIKDSHMANYLQRYLPKLVLMDSPLPFLEDMLQENIHIVLIKDPALTFNDTTLAQLKKRVHYTETLEEAKQLLQEYFDGKLEEKRDTSYADIFCNRGSLQERIMRHIKLLNESKSLS